MERKMLDLKLQDKIPYSEIRKRTKTTDMIEYTLKQKWRWAGHIARMKDNRWTKRCTEWQPRRGKRSRGRPSRRWQDDITRKEGTTWIRKATDRRQWKALMDKAKVKGKVLLVACFTSQQHASVSQEWICSDNCTCCNTLKEVVDRTFYLTQSQYTDTGPTSPRAEPYKARRLAG